MSIVDDIPRKSTKSNDAALLENSRGSISFKAFKILDALFSVALGPQNSDDTAAEIHAADRVTAGFTGEQVMAEFRALRSSVLRLWAGQVDITTTSDIQDMIRFNQAIDQAQTESMARYAKMLREAQNLFLAILGHDVRTPLGAAQAFSNLISNTVQHGKPDCAIKVTLRGFPDEVIYEVRNEAEAIPPTKLRTLFDPVKRFAIRPPSERVAAGTPNLGLGLYVVKQIVDAHHGEISVTSSEDDGVVFSARLPRVTPNRRTDDE